MNDSARTIVPLMAFAVTVSLLGHTLEPQRSKADPHVGDAQILLGGTVATVLLTLLGTGGDVGARFAKGVALVALLGSVALYGTPVVRGLNRITGQVTSATAIPTTTKAKGASK